MRSLDESAADHVRVPLPDTKVVEPDASISLPAVELAASHRLPAIDALIHATAFSLNATPVICDEHFKDLPQMQYSAKR